MNSSQLFSHRPPTKTTLIRAMPPSERKALSPQDSRNSSQPEKEPTPETTENGNSGE